eukprot:COSAG02_NODE_2358_length_9064_cov_12.658003_4_plen_89_part_00
MGLPSRHYHSGNLPREKFGPRAGLQEGIGKHMRQPIFFNFACENDRTSISAAVTECSHVVKRNIQPLWYAACCLSQYPGWGLVVLVAT